MKLTTLGSWGAYPYQDAGTTSYLVTGHDGFQLLMDAGSRALNELEKEISPLDLDAVIISHYHPDHVADLGVLRHYFQLYPKHLWQPKVLPIYGHDEDRHEFAKLSIPDVSEGRAYDVTGVEQIGPFDITFLKTVHPVVCYAFRIVERATGQVLVFTGDSGYFEGLADFAKEADLFLADVYLYEGNENHMAHLTSKEAGLMASQAGVKKLVLTHMPPVPPEGIDPDNHLEVLRQETQAYAGNIPVDLALPHKSWNLGSLS
ncbi:metal-dependent hydrolase [Streptococcus pyogenes JRS4]|uniref:MBL fold metallo-hydrolase n=3 Tax=Streptococcus pyogenes TaxID=1314 RepID=A0A5S4TK47_STRPY|nr:MBL fold metallo-hydrolase [Streptococcus pyogenes]ABF35243.1 Metal-dependent hydrolase [Streptococcus pyogenes MGAS2096]EQL79655.1 beta-lactamase family protein [Streptococcus pyogenes UTSW-2]EQL83040.1 beta-lactamase family protein [Streptococcus pyogenes GA19681]ERL14813.1 beta-lactamase family protein [Streptococcus pyogenes GA06023]ESA45527.1 beta-lactamase family protein [Streptococcus pyogenes GA41039]ESA48725.1 beta-lactamase family protein [Streptococcus pyogenes GA41208]ESA49709